MVCYPVCPTPILPLIQAARTRSAAGRAGTAAPVGSWAAPIGTPVEETELLASDPSVGRVRSEGVRMVGVATAYRAVLAPWEVPNSAAESVAQTTADLPGREAAERWDVPAWVGRCVGPPPMRPSVVADSSR